MTETETEFESETDRIRWSHMSLADLETFWNARIEPALRDAGHDLEDRPTYQDLLEVGYGGIQYTLREHHDLTLSAFCERVGYVDADDESGYRWGIDDEATLEELESYVDTLRRRRRELSDATVETRRSRLATYVRTYSRVHGDAALVDRADDPALHADEIRRALAVFDELDRDLESDESKLRYLESVDQFYRHRMRRKTAAYNPVESIDEEYGWQRKRRDNPPLSASDVRALNAAAGSLAERVMVLALCGWGLRRGEVARLAHGQLALEGDDPHIAFEDRKNVAVDDDQVTVPIIYGRETIADRVAQLGTREDGWNGYVFPSSRSATGHVTPKTIAARFERLAERADVTVRGETPTPQYGRRFWYTTYRTAIRELLENELQFIADEQGSSDPMVVFRNYFSEDERRRLARDVMRDRLADAFDE
ncbi:tyrosine-type recombinase/integrase [Natronolimnohabitans innermongolicus]|uniref:Integrase family protein n=1 Tax=Natronolimnohabitans innermongolicus JCM 12255 TaxID=1227499 RepID=L9WH21_9EURY|nr:tyrosine-type recombinase/integrase [Natronolimnohabitans innermongolicus]ELY48815.1 integrase family protein [Natronolimnohabitans innermongolicus JCM 12255]